MIHWLLSGTKVGENSNNQKDINLLIVPVKTNPILNLFCCKLLIINGLLFCYFVE
jgi:hypothetical protein